MNLEEEVRRTRQGSTHIVERRSSFEVSPMLQLLDDFVGKHGLTGIGSRWNEISRNDATAHLARILHRDLAYDCVLMPTEQAASIAAKFIDLFGEARYFSNTIPNREDGTRAQGWNSITDATFDSGIIAVGQLEIGILWVEDED
jgi:hypothetical protein